MLDFVFPLLNARGVQGTGQVGNEIKGLSDSPCRREMEKLAFKFPLRRYQEEILELMKIKMERGERQLHIVAPPGAGKTIIGLQMVSLLKQPSLIISPTTTIQSQWAEKLDLFLPDEELDFSPTDILGTHENKPLAPITLLTYQVLSTPGKEIEYLESMAQKNWVAELVAGGLSGGDAEVRILELLANNKKAHTKEISRHITRLRRRLTDVLNLEEVLHPNALELIQSLRRQKFKVIIFDECHHLTDYWAAIMQHLVKRLDDPVVIGLTGTPPEGKSRGQEDRYLSLVGEIDYQVPTPALVREGGLAPFQDLVLFTSPSSDEEKFLAEQHADFHSLIESFTQGSDSRLSQYVADKINTHARTNWTDFAQTNPDLARALIRYAFAYRLNLEDGISVESGFMASPVFADWMELLEAFALYKLKPSPEKQDHLLFERIKNAVSRLGYGITERGLRKQASPVDRVLAFSRNKARGAAEILTCEYESLEDRLRAVVVTDFERMSATGKSKDGNILSSETGGSISVLKEILFSPVGSFINPCMVTGSLIYVDRAIAERFIAALNDLLNSEIQEDEKWAGKDFETLKARIVDDSDPLFVEVSSPYSGWESRLYVGLVTRILERGITKVLVGTRGIFGEGWDCQALNTLIDLTTTTTPMSVKQLRGRSIRINTQDPLGQRKVANNWDVVCIAPHLEKGLNDFERFARKHHGYFGICDDGQIECGVSHVHASLQELTPAEVFASQDEFNKEMKLRSLARDAIYDLWKVGQPYKNRTLGCLELGRLRQPEITPPNIKHDLSYKEHARVLRANLVGVVAEYGLLGVLLGVVTAGISSMLSPLLLPVAALQPVIALALARRKYRILYDQLKSQVAKPPDTSDQIRDFACCLLSALIQCKFLPSELTRDLISVSKRSDGSFRVFLDGCTQEQSNYFVKSLKELLTPISNQPFLIPKYEFTLSDKDTPGNVSPEERFFKAYLRGHATPNLVSYYPVPSLLARSERGREAFELSWNKYVSPGSIVATEDRPELLRRYFGLGPDVAQRLLWE